MERVFSEQPDDIACVILEPTGASYGTIPLPDGFLAGIKDVAHKYGALLIFDEIVTGFRYSPGGVQAQTGVIPDITTLAKIVAGGFAGGAVVGRADMMSALEFRPGDAEWNRYHRINHPGTFNANPLSAAAGVAMLKIAATGEPQEQIARMGREITIEMNNAIASPGWKEAAFTATAHFSCAAGQGSMCEPGWDVGLRMCGYCCAQAGEHTPGEGRIPGRYARPRG